MNESVFRGYVLIWLSFLIAIILQVIPWPGDLAVFRPSWLLLITFYWVLALPHRISVGSALILGIVWDLTLGAVLGIRGFMMSILIYIVALNFQMIRNMSLWQQAALLTVLSLLSKIIVYWLEYLVAPIAFDPNMFWAGVLNFLLWPWLFLLLRRIRRKFSIS